MTPARSEHANQLQYVVGARDKALVLGILLPIGPPCLVVAYVAFDRFPVAQVPFPANMAPFLMAIIGLLALWGVVVVIVAREGITVDVERRELRRWKRLFGPRRENVVDLRPYRAVQVTRFAGQRAGVWFDMSLVGDGVAPYQIATFKDAGDAERAAQTLAGRLGVALDRH